MSGSIFLARTETSVQENADTIQVEIRRSGGFVGDVTMLYGVTGDTATTGAAYTVGGTGSIVMAAGLDSITVPITIVNDTLAEGTEVTTFALISATGAALTAPRTNRISILDDEAPSPPPPTEPPLSSPYDVSRVVAVNGLDTPVRFAFSPVDPNVVLVAEKAGIIRLANVETGGLGANFGWPYYEGGDGSVLNQAPGYNGLPGAIQITPAFRAFAHDGRAPGFALQSITSGGVFLPGNPYPEALLNDFVFSDFVGGNVYTVDTSASGTASWR